MAFTWEMLNLFFALLLDHTIWGFQRSWYMRYFLMKVMWESLPFEELWYKNKCVQRIAEIEIYKGKSLVNVSHSKGECIFCYMWWRDYIGSRWGQVLAVFPKYLPWVCSRFSKTHFSISVWSDSIHRGAGE